MWRLTKGLLYRDPKQNKKTINMVETMRFNPDGQNTMNTVD